MVFEERVGVASRDDLALVEDEDGVEGDDGAEAVGDAEDGAVEVADDVLDAGVRVRVDGGRRLVGDEEGGALEEGAGEAEELGLARGDVGPALADLAVEREAGERDARERRGDGAVAAAREGSRFERTVPEKRVAAWGTRARWARSVERGRLATSRPSTAIVPRATSTTRKRPLTRLLLPAPVRPTTPQRWPAGTAKETPWRTRPLDVG